MNCIVFDCLTISVGSVYRCNRGKKDTKISNRSMRLQGKIHELGVQRSTRLRCNGNRETEFRIFCPMWPPFSVKILERITPKPRNTLKLNIKFPMFTVQFSKRVNEFNRATAWTFRVTSHTVGHNSTSFGIVFTISPAIVTVWLIANCVLSIMNKPFYIRCADIKMPIVHKQRSTQLHSVE